MEEMNKSFVPRLNDFTEKMKEVQKLHVQHILELSEQQKILRECVADMRKDMQIECKTQEINNNINIREYPAYIEMENKLITFEKHIAEFRTNYQNYINDSNFMLGRTSNHWGGYIEQVGVEYILNLLRKEYGVHTWCHKFKRYWDKSKNAEIDLVALNDTHAYIIEVKNQLKPETITQILTTHEKIEKHVPELKRYTKQAVVMCIHADKEILKTLNWANVWVLRYEGFELEKQKNNWEWLQGKQSN